MEEELDISEMGDMLSNSFMGAEKLGPPVATSSALDRLESTCTGGDQLHVGGEVGPARRHQLGTGPP